MRIIAGMAKGITLSTPTSDRTRPSSDRVKEAIFSALQNEIDIQGLNVVDLFAGTGALGLEAISRGARECTFVEKNQEMCKVIKTNVEKVKKAVLQYETIQPVFKIISSDVEKVVRGAERSDTLNNADFDIAICDPPYAFDYINIINIIKLRRSISKILSSHSCHTCSSCI